MDPKAKKNLEQFKKEIKRQAMEKKKTQARRNLPFYDNYFKQKDEQSDGTNSRSSRFPVRTQWVNEGVNTYEKQSNSNLIQRKEIVFMSQKQKQSHFLDYIRNFDLSNFSDKKAMIEHQMTSLLGHNCFQDLKELEQCVEFQILELVQYFQRQSVKINTQKVNWNFIIASYYLAKNQKFQKIQNLAVSLLLKHFNKGLLQVHFKDINGKKSIKELEKSLKGSEQLEIQVEEIIISKLMYLNEVEMDENMLPDIIHYFKQKMAVFLKVQSILSELYYTEQVQTLLYCETVYNYQSIYVVESLCKLAGQNQLYQNARINLCELLCKYFTNYPTIVVSETQNFQKLQTTVDLYLLQAYSLISDIICRKKENQLSQQDMSFLLSSLVLSRSLFQRDVNDHLQMRSCDLYGLILDVVVRKNLTYSFINNLDLHIQVLRTSSLMMLKFECFVMYFKTHQFFGYFQLLFLLFREFKGKYRLQPHLGLKLSPVSLVCVQDLQFQMIHVLHCIELIEINAGITAYSNESFLRLKKVADLDYCKQRDYLQTKSSVSSELNLYFKNNVRLYFQNLKFQTQQFIPNPENHHLNDDLEI